MAKAKSAAAKKSSGSAARSRTAAKDLTARNSGVKGGRKEITQAEWEQRAKTKDFDPR